MEKALLFISIIIGYLSYGQGIDMQIALPPQSDPSIVIFSYDNAGNQIYRGPDGLICANCQNSNTTITSSLADQMANKIQAAPVPVKTDLTVIWDNSVKDYITKIDLLPYNAFTIVETVNVRSLADNSYVFKMSNYSYGVYYLKFYLKDGSIYTRTVTKN